MGRTETLVLITCQSLKRKARDEAEKKDRGVAGYVGPLDLCADESRNIPHTRLAMAQLLTGSFMGTARLEIVDGVPGFAARTKVRTGTRFMNQYSGLQQYSNSQVPWDTDQGSRSCGRYPLGCVRTSMRFSTTRLATVQELIVLADPQQRCESC